MKKTVLKRTSIALALACLTGFALPANEASAAFQPDYLYCDGLWISCYNQHHACLTGGGDAVECLLEMQLCQLDVANDPNCGGEYYLHAYKPADPNG